jgi:hypothetical protein
MIIRIPTARCPPVAAGQREDGDADETQRGARDGGAARRVPGQQAQADQPERHLGDEQGG